MPKSPIPQKYLREYRCPRDGKLLCKGHLNGRDNIVEVKCRGCGEMSIFSGEDAEIITERSVLIKQGLIPDSEAELGV